MEKLRPSAANLQKLHPAGSEPENFCHRRGHLRAKSHGHRPAAQIENLLELVFERLVVWHVLCLFILPRAHVQESEVMSSAAKALTARQFFSRHGVLSKWHPRYEFRAGQLEMAEAVEAALAEKKHLLVDAGTGTGKTLAYLVPALLSGKRVVVSTGTKNLQEQLFYKDIPFLQQHFDRPAASLLHERPRQLRLPPEDLRCRSRADA